jgi:4-amino-4-deoxy-L-arabinose transferase-like glycosyltransferase
VLFPTHSSEPTQIRLWSLVFILILPAALLYPTRSFRLLEPDEGRYAEIAREMYSRGEWVLPVLQGQPYLDKPPLLYWLVEISYAIFGVSDAAARWIPALAVHGCILLIYLLGRRSLGERSALWGALLLTVAPGFLGMGRLLILDGLLTFCVTLSLLAGFEAIRGANRGATFDRWWLISALAGGFGVLTKGPIALILLFPPLIGYQILVRQKIGISWRILVRFPLVVLAVNLPWYVAIYLREPVFLKHFFWDHNVMRFLQPFDHLQPIWYYTPVLLGGLLPGTLLLWSFGRFLLTGDEQVAARRTRELGFWLLAGTWCVFFFSLSGSKLPTYVLPAFPCFALVLGDFIARSRWDQSNWTKAGIGVMIGILAFATYFAIPWYAQQRSPMIKPDVIVHYCGADAPVICFPRNCDSISFYMGRDDFRNVRTKASQELVEAMMVRPRTVVLFTHRHSLETLKLVLPPQLRIVETATLQRKGDRASWIDRFAGDSPWGLCDLAIIERIP